MLVQSVESYPDITDDGIAQGKAVPVATRRGPRAARSDPYE
jgi:hypothetical protein